MVAWPGACRPETPCVGPTFGTIPSSPRYCLRRLQRSFTIHHILPKSAGRDVVPIKEQAFATVRESDLKAPASTDSFVFEDADAVCHPAL
jgi:hypothetical protein